jgi:electron transfer flavoprotein alpha/beta subunit
MIIPRDIAIVRAVRAAQPASVVVAVPVGPPSAIEITLTFYRKGGDRARFDQRSKELPAAPRHCILKLRQVSS